MARIELFTHINAPIQKCFDLARSIDLHIQSIQHTGERAIAGRTSGLIELDESVTWRAKHFCVWQNLTSKITVFEPPYVFVDEMVSGAFKNFRHEHCFSGEGLQTTMHDIFIYKSPLGWLGSLANLLFLKKYMTNLLVKRNKFIKQIAEQQ